MSSPTFTPNQQQPGLPVEVGRGFNFNSLVLKQTLYLTARASNEGYPKVRKDFTITEKAPTRHYCESASRRFQPGEGPCLRTFVWRFVSSSSPDPTLGNMNRMETIVQQPGRAGRASNCILKILAFSEFCTINYLRSSRRRTALHRTI